MDIDVSIIIVNYNTIKLTVECIKSIIKRTLNINYEIIVVDNNSSDDCKKVLNNLFEHRVTIVESKSNLGFGKGNNLGVKKARGRNILFLNPDTLLANNAISILSNHLDNNNDVAACGGNLIDFDGNPIHSYNIVYPSIFDELDQASHRVLSRLIYGKSTMYNYNETPKNVAYITGADLMIKSNVLNQLGGFDSAFFMYYEETDLQNRIKKKGYKIQNVPSAKIIHLEGASFSVSKKREYMCLTSRKIYYKKHYHFLYCWFANKMYLGLNQIGLYIGLLLNNQNLIKKLRQRVELIKEIYK